MRHAGSPAPVIPALKTQRGDGEMTQWFESTGCSTNFNSHYPHGDSQPLTPSVPGDLTPTSNHLYDHCMPDYVMYINKLKTKTKAKTQD